MSRQAFESIEIMIHGASLIPQAQVIESMCPSSIVQVVHLASPGAEVPADSAKPVVDDETEKCFVDILPTKILKLTEHYFCRQESKKYLFKTFVFSHVLNQFFGHVFHHPS